MYFFTKYFYKHPRHFRSAHVSYWGKVIISSWCLKNHSDLKKTNYTTRHFILTNVFLFFDENIYFPVNISLKFFLFYNYINYIGSFCRLSISRSLATKRHPLKWYEHVWNSIHHLVVSWWLIFRMKKNDSWHLFVLWLVSWNILEFYFISDTGIVNTTHFELNWIFIVDSMLT